MLDEEESYAAAPKASGIGKVWSDLLQEGRQFTDQDSASLRNASEAEAFGHLKNLAIQRASRGELSGAARTCFNIIGLMGSSENPSYHASQEVWLLLAMINGVYGDRGKAEQCLAVADNEANEELQRLKDIGPRGKDIHNAYRRYWKDQLGQAQKAVKKGKLA